MFDYVKTRVFEGDSGDYDDYALGLVLAALGTRQQTIIINNSTGFAYFYGDAEAIATEQAAEAAALATYDAAAALLDPEDENYATDLAALAVTRDAAYAAARLAIYPMISVAANARQDIGSYCRGALYMSLENADGLVTITEFA